MTGVIDAAGTVGEGAAWARAAEPQAGESHRDAHGTTCLNCDTQLVGRYCHACGQSSHVHRTLMSIVHDLLHGVFHFEGKIWRTLPMLVLHPGMLTRRYIEGERARFVSPLALFLFTVFLMFATFSALGPGDLAKGFENGWSKAAPALEQQRNDTAAEIVKLDKERAGLAAAGRSTAAIGARIAERRADLAAATRITGKLASAPTTVNVRSDWDWFDQALNKAKQNPGLIIYKVQSAAYKFSWALILLSTPLVALLFLWRRRFGLYDHATFVTYSITFMSLLVILVQLLAAIPVPKIVTGALLVFAPPAHMFVQLRGAYSLSIVSALWRTVALLMFCSWALALFAIGVIAIEVAG